MVNATTVHVWMVAQARRRAAGPASARQPAWPAAVPSTRLGLSHPQTHPAVASTIYPSARSDAAKIPWRNRGPSGDVASAKTGTTRVPAYDTEK
jgi:hypothetical protein